MMMFDWGIGSRLWLDKSFGMYVAAKTLLQLNPCSLIAKFIIDLMYEKIRLTDDELSPWTNRYSLNADASLGANEVILTVDVASLR